MRQPALLVTNINIRLPISLRDALDAWCLGQPDAPCRSEGVRQILEAVLSDPPGLSLDRQPRTKD